MYRYVHSSQIYSSPISPAVCRRLSFLLRLSCECQKFWVGTFLRLASETRQARLIPRQWQCLHALWLLHVFVLPAVLRRSATTSRQRRSHCVSCAWDFPPSEFPTFDTFDKKMVSWLNKQDFLSFACLLRDYKKLSSNCRFKNFTRL